MSTAALPPTVRVDELVLRPLAVSDRAAYLEILNVDDGVARWTTIPFPYRTADFDQVLERPRENKYVIVRDERVAGGIGMDLDLEASTARLGYWLSPEARGHGVITRAARELCNAAFDLGMQRIVAEVIVGNLSSGRVLDRLGFTLEGVARSVHAPRCGLSEARIDEQIWSLLPGELV